MSALPLASEAGATHPRPQLIRASHCALDVRCGFAIDADRVGLTEHWFTADGAFTDTIQLPFAPETAASGIEDPGFHPVVWYAIDLTPEHLARAGLGSQGERLLLHFGAVDYLADVWVNGQHVARHEGGYTPFSVDITDALCSDPAAPQRVVLRAEDDPMALDIPRGKQDWREQQHAVWYRRSTGIWRTVWLEAVPALHVRDLAWGFDLASATILLDVELSERPSQPVEVRVSIEGIEEAERAWPLQLATTITERTAALRIALPAEITGIQLEELFWSPASPRLFDARIEVAADAVASYLGLCTIGWHGSQLLLNDRPFTFQGVLEQGYWPDSGFTAPSVDALLDEVDLILHLGFNGVRIHQKTEDPRFLYWCDRLGLATWVEAPSAYVFNPGTARRLTEQWCEIVRTYRSHPSVITWVPVNESWGVPQVARAADQQALVRALADLTRALDPSRPVISNDGWEHLNSDVFTVHDYAGEPAAIAQRYGSREALTQLAGSVGPGGRRLVIDEAPDVSGSRLAELMAAPAVLSEFGGVSFAVTASPQGWGYSTARDAGDFRSRLAGLLQAVHECKDLAGFCYTQLTDTGLEVNGLCTADREPKLPADDIAAMVRGQG